MEENKMPQTVPEEPENTDNVSVSEQASPYAEQFERLGKLIEAHFNAVCNLLRYTKEKDANVMALSKQLQQYRDGVEGVLFKRIALDVIGYREDCRKSLRELGEIAPADAKKYMGYLVQDYEDLLQNLGIEGTEEDFTYHGKKPVCEGKIAYRDIPAEEEIAVPAPDVTDAESLAAYLAACEDGIRAILARNTALDCVLSDYVAASSLYEQGVWMVVLVPVIRKMLACGRKLSELVEKETGQLQEDNASKSYADALAYALEICDGILEMCNVVIDGAASEVYDPKRHRILKMIPTEDAALNGRVVNRYTDCYLMEEKVIYPSKVDVCKIK